MTKVKKGLFAVAMAAALVVGSVEVIRASIVDKTHATVESKLDEIMEQLNGTARKLEKTIGAAEGAKEAAAALAKMQGLAIEAKGLEPRSAADVAADKKDAFLADFKKQLNKLITKLIEIENLVLDGKPKDAEAAFKTLKPFTKESHGKFKKD